MVFSKRFIPVLCLSMLSVLPAKVYAQTSHDTIQSYVDAGGLRNFEIKSSDDSIDEVLRTLDNQKGSSIYSDFIFYTAQHSFKGSLIQTTDKYYVVAELDRVNPQRTIVKRLHVIERDEVVGVTATFAN
ncbi:MAG: hypothetical protein GW778_02055 [Alphaproteobacteria bacterium]|nr:hypothetical protein [Alphaproteobacteria bacterium]